MTNNLYKRGFVIPNRCVLYEVNGENAFHILIGYEYSFTLWIKFLRLWDLGWFFPDSLDKFYDQWKLPSYSPVLRGLWDLMALHIAWGLWKERNNRIFRDSKLKVDSILIKVCQSILENFALIRFDSTRCDPNMCLASYKSRVTLNWKISSVPIMTPKASTIARRNIRWQPPPTGWIKINFDGATKGDLGPVG